MAAFVLRGECASEFALVCWGEGGGVQCRTIDVCALISLLRGYFIGMILLQKSLISRIRSGSKRAETVPKDGHRMLKRGVVRRPKASGVPGTFASKCGLP